MSPGGETTEGADGGNWAEQPRQITKRTTNARRTIMNRNHLSMRKPLDYLMAARRHAPWRQASRFRDGACPVSAGNQSCLRRVFATTLRQSAADSSTRNEIPPGRE